jgi:hypothetical protein
MEKMGAEALVDLVRMADSLGIERETPQESGQLV